MLASDSRSKNFQRRCSQLAAEKCVVVSSYQRQGTGSNANCRWLLSAMAQHAAEVARTIFEEDGQPNVQGECTGRPMVAVPRVQGVLVEQVASRLAAIQQYWVEATQGLAIQGLRRCTSGSASGRKSNSGFGRRDTPLASSTVSWSWIQRCDAM